MKILTAPDSFLRRKAAPLEKVTADVIERIEEMLALMHASGGVGLAAPQVDWDARVFVMNEHPGRFCKNWDMAWINPEIEVLGKGKGQFLVPDPLWVPSEEGCLSIPGVRGEVLRARHVLIKGIGLARADRGPRSGLLCNWELDSEDVDPTVKMVPGAWEVYDRTTFMRESEPSRLVPFIVQHETDHLQGTLFTDKLMRTTS